MNDLNNHLVLEHMLKVLQDYLLKNVFTLFCNKITNIKTYTAKYGKTQMTTIYSIASW